MNQKNLKLCWEEAVLDAKLPDSPREEWALIGNLCKDAEWKHFFTVGHKAFPGSKDPSLVAPSHFLAWAVESIKKILAYTGLKGTVNSALN